MLARIDSGTRLQSQEEPEGAHSGRTRTTKRPSATRRTADVSRGNLLARLAVLLATLAVCPAPAAEPATMRLDFSHTGGQGAEIFAGNAS